MKNSRLSAVVLRNSGIRWFLLLTVLVSAHAQAGKVKILIMGDTQKITDQKPNDFVAAMGKMITDDVTKDADFALQMGDITEDDKTSCWQAAQEGWKKLDGHMPYILNVGNNDSNGDKFCHYFPLNIYSAWPSFVDNYDDHRNVAHHFNAGGVDWLVISLKRYPDPGQMNWAEGLVKDNPDKKVIFVSHAANEDGGDWSVLRTYENLVFALCGHTGSREVLLTGSQGNKIGWIKTCWHNPDKDHYVRVLELDTETGTAKFRFYSPLDGQYDGGETTWTGFDFGGSANTPPEITSTPSGLEIEEGEEFTYTLTAEDADSDPLTLSGETVPAWLSFNENTGVLSGTPGADDVGSHSVTLRVSDGSGNADQEFAIIVSEAITGAGPALPARACYIRTRVLETSGELRVAVPARYAVQTRVKVINTAGEAAEGRLVLSRQNDTFADYRLDVPSETFPAGRYILSYEADGKPQRELFILRK